MDDHRDTHTCAILPTHTHPYPDEYANTHIGTPHTREREEIDT